MGFKIGHEEEVEATVNPIGFLIQVLYPTLMVFGNGWIEVRTLSMLQMSIYSQLLLSMVTMFLSTMICPISNGPKYQSLEIDWPFCTR